MTSESMKKRISPTAARAPMFRATAGPTRPGEGTMRTGKLWAMARDRSVEPSSTSTTSKLSQVDWKTRVRHSASVASALYTGMTTEMRVTAGTAAPRFRDSHRAIDVTRARPGAPSRFASICTCRMSPYLLRRCRCREPRHAQLEPLRQLLHPRRLPAGEIDVLAGVAGEVEQHPLAARGHDQLVVPVVDDADRPVVRGTVPLDEEGVDAFLRVRGPRHGRERRALDARGQGDVERF